MEKLVKIFSVIAVLTMSALGVTAQTVGYFASTSGPYGAVANNAGLNIGHTFTVANTNIQVFSLGVYDFGGDGLKAAHTVTLFTNQTPLASVTVPAGDAATLLNGFRFAALPSPITLPPGNYAVVAYQMNGTANSSDGYGDQPSGGHSGFNGSFAVADTLTIFEFTSNTNAYPGTGGSSLGTASSDLASASFTYTDMTGTTIGYTADPTQTQTGQAAGNGLLNIGHNFNVTGAGIQVFRLGVFDGGADGLAESHTVTLFVNDTVSSTQTELASVTVPAGTSAPLGNGFRWVSLDTPLTLTEGSYSVIAYGMDINDPYGENNVTGFNPAANVVDSGFSPYEFTDSPSPAFPGGGAYFLFAASSFDFTNIGTINSGPTIAYTGDPSGPYGAAADNAGLNIGHTFTLAGTNISISHLGVYDYLADGLNAEHTVTLFAYANGQYVPISGGSITVPAGTAADLTNGYRFAPLPKPIAVPPGQYAVVAYQMNGTANGNDGYNDSNGSINRFFGNGYLTDGPAAYEFTTNASPSFPGTGGGNSGTPTENFGCASIIYSLSSTSSMAVASVVASPSLTYAAVGQTTSLTASAFGTAPIRYQWYYGNPPIAIPTATNATLNLTNIQSLAAAGNMGLYWVMASNAYGSSPMSSSIEVRLIPATSTVKIMALGDSITYGQGAAGGYRAPLYQSLVENLFNVVYVGTQNNNATAWLPQPNHEGHSGYRIDQIASDFQTWVDSVPDPDIILLLIGTNDYGQDYDTANAKDRLDQLIALITATRPNAKLFVANLTLRTDNADTEAAIEATFNPFVPEIVASHASLGEHVYFVDMNSALSASDLGDGLHPNQSGYNKMAATWFQAITNAIPTPGFNRMSASLSGTNSVFNYLGSAGHSYVIEQASTLTAPIKWQPVATNATAANGVLTFTNAPQSGSQGYLRTRRLP